MKKQVRVCGIDDAPFVFGDRDAKAMVVGTIVRTPTYLEGVLKFEVSVDGDDSTAQIERAISGSRFRDQIRALLIDGIALGGFNIVDIEALGETLEMPVITVTRDRPNIESIRSALSKYFDDWEERLEKISRLPSMELSTEHNPIYVSYASISRKEAEKIIRYSTVRGAIPEPIRMAHIIASGVVRGESRGKA